MPIEIRELVIRATVEAGDSAGSGGCAGPSPAAQASARAQTHADGDLVQTCVREVLRILEDKRER